MMMMMMKTNIRTGDLTMLTGELLWSSHGTSPGSNCLVCILSIKAAFTCRQSLQCFSPKWIL